MILDIVCRISAGALGIVLCCMLINLIKLEKRAQRNSKEKRKNSKSDSQEDK